MEEWEIQTRIINEVVVAYSTWYDPNAVCNCGQEVEIDGVLLPKVCKIHEFRKKKEQLQKEITQQGLSIPIPKMVKPEVPHGYTDVNPLYSKPFIDKYGGGTQQAARLASYLSTSHVVFYLDRTKFINLAYSQRDQEVEDIMLFSPVIVYHHNSDGRANGRDEALLLSRQYGFCYQIRG